MPHAFGDYADRPDLTLYGDHEQMLHEYFWTAYHPIGPKSTEPITGTNETYLPGVFGDIFDVVYAYPDVNRWTTLDTYPVVIAAGDIELTAAEGQRLAQYVENGGTLLVADGQLSGPGVAALALPALGVEGVANRYIWSLTGTSQPAQRFRYREIPSGKPLAITADGKVFCAAFDRGQGRLIVLSVPRGLGIDRTAVPVVPQLFAHLTRGLMPVEVRGDVEWLRQPQQYRLARDTAESRRSGQTDRKASRRPISEKTAASQSTRQCRSPQPATGSSPTKS